MKSSYVKEFMFSLEEYVTVNEEDSLYDALLVLEEAQKGYFQKVEAHMYPHKALLVLNKENDVVGKLSQFDIIRSLEPKYKSLISSELIARTATSGFSAEFLKNMLNQYALFELPLADLCRRAAKKRVKDCMYTPAEAEYVTEDDTLAVAIHQFVVGHHQSLLVTKDGKITGILRMADVFKYVCQTLKECALKS
jgi:hypothetical protein